jgi:Holliday junction resolvase-like predicted endonuclease
MARPSLVARCGGVFGALDARWEPLVSWRGGALDRLLDEDHSRLVAATARRLRERGWTILVEVTYSLFGERGSIDVLAARPSVGTVLSVEVKSEITTVEATLRKIDEKDRLVRRLICAERFGFRPRFVGRLLVLPGTDTTRRRVLSNAVVLDAALPARGATVRRWLAEPRGDLSGIWTVANTNGSGGTRTGGGPKRVRRAKERPTSGDRAPVERGRAPPWAG